MGLINNRMNRQTRPGEQGFTIIEFMIATAVFSLVILLCSLAIVHIGRVYYKGVITNRTQDASRKVLDDLTTVIQFSAPTADPNLFMRTGSDTFAHPGGGNVTVQVLCLGTNRYSYMNDRAQGTAANQIRHVFWKDRPSAGCNSSEPANLTLETPSPDGQEMLGSNMRLPELTITPDATGRGWNIRAVISYGDEPGLFENGSNFSMCKGIVSGGQFCAASTFETSVTKRL